jgi:hypothetical protein
MPAFSCFSREGVDLCLSGGYCDNSTGGISCICPPGYVHDNTFFHFANCALPEQFYLVFFIVSSIVSFPLLVAALFLLRSASGTSRRITIYMFIMILFAWGYHAAMYLENGCYIGALICLLISLAAEGACMANVVLSFVDPVFSLKHNQSFVITLKRLLWGRWFAAGYVLIFLPSGILLPIFSRRDDETYNNFVTAFLLITITVGFTLLFSIFWFLFRLERAIYSIISTSEFSQHSVANKKLQEFHARLKPLKIGSAIATMEIVSAITPIPLLYLTMGSLPYTWIFSPVLAYTGCVFYCFYLLRFLYIRRGRREQTKATSSNNLGDAPNKDHENILVVPPKVSDTLESSAAIVAPNL